MDLFFPDPVIESSILEEPVIYLKRTGLFCSHCNKEIRGKIHNLGPKFYDDYCWSLRFILEAQEVEIERHAELRKRIDHE